MIRYTLFNARVPESLMRHIKSKVSFRSSRLYDHIGGDLFLIKTLDDVSRMPFSAEEAIDVVEHVGQYVIFQEVTNNAGGDLFAVPHKIYKQSEYLKGIEVATQDYWNS